jgi:hypothetical protein
MGKIKRVQYVTLLVVFVITLGSVAFISNASAGTLTHTSLLELGGASNATPMIAATGQQLTLAFTAASTGASTISIDFGGTAWTTPGGVVNGTQSVTTAGCQALTGATNVVPGTLAASGTGQVISVTGATSMTSGQSYCVNLTSTTAVTNPSTGVYTVTITENSDTTKVALDVLSSGLNAYSITGTIAPTFTMTLSGTTDTFASNLTSTPSVNLSTGITATINTNAASGWFVWAADSNAGLHSTTAATTIGTVTTGSNHTMNSGGTGPGNNAYAFGISANSTGNYAYGGGTTGGGLAIGTFNEVATSASPASNVTFVAHELANISSTEPPATDYTDTITLIGAGSF